MYYNVLVFRDTPYERDRPELPCSGRSFFVLFSIWINRRVFHDIVRYRERLFDDIVYKNPKNPLVFKKSGGLVYKIVVKIVYKPVVKIVYKIVVKKKLAL